MMYFKINAWCKTMFEFTLSFQAVSYVDTTRQFLHSILPILSGPELTSSMTVAKTYQSVFSKLRLNSSEAYTLE